MPPAERRPRLLLLAMYPLDEETSGPTVRIARILAALRRRAEVEVIDGARPARRVRLIRHLVRHRFRAVDGVYVESSTALPSEVDIAWLLAARAAGRRVLTYVRDAYQIFPDYYPQDTPKRWLAARLFRPAMAALEAASSQLAFPTRGLAEAVLGRRAERALLLPPGAPPPVDLPERPGAQRLLYVGDLRIPAQGGADLVEAVRQAREQGIEVALTCVTRAGAEPPGPHPDWLRVERASGDQIPDLLGEVVASVIPRRAASYNDLALPIKLMDYLSYGRPLIVTDRRETAALVRSAGCGIVVGDGPAELGKGIARVMRAGPAERRAWGAAAAAAARANSWDERADRILLSLHLV